MRKLDELLMTAQQGIVGMDPKTVSKRVKTARIGFVAFSCISILLSLYSTAFATDAIATGIASGMQQFYSLIRMISIPVAAVAVGAAAFQIFTGGEKGMEKAKKIIIYTGIGIGVALLAPKLVEMIAGWFQGASRTSDVKKFTN